MLVKKITNYKATKGKRTEKLELVNEEQRGN